MSLWTIYHDYANDILTVGWAIGGQSNIKLHHGDHHGDTKLHFDEMMKISPTF
jgi:hypothetical protein